MYPSITQKYKNVPNKMESTPKVALFEAAWFLVYTSGSLTNPMALSTLSKDPNKMMIPNKILRVSITFNHDSFLKKLGEGYRSNKGDNRN